MFHHCQSVLRGIPQCGLKKDYDKNEDFRRIARRALGLPFLPRDLIVWLQATGDFELNEKNARICGLHFTHLCERNNSWLSS